VKYIIYSKAFKSLEFKRLASKFRHIFTLEKWITFAGQVDHFLLDRGWIWIWNDQYDSLHGRF